MNRCFLDYFRCPERYARFVKRAEPNTETGFFRFGAETVCYGKYRGARQNVDPIESLQDANLSTRIENEIVYLPFDPDEICAQLRNELYARPDQHLDSAWTSAINRTYYFMRPMLPVSLRKHLQKMRLNGWNDEVFPRWPVDTSVDSLNQKLLSLALKAQGVSQIPFIWFWPKGFSSAAIMTHDVETLKGKDFCGALMDMDDSFGFKASFQIVPERRYEVTEEFIDSILSRGFELGVQDLNHDGRLYSSKQEFMKRVSKINSYGRKWGSEGFRGAVLYRRQEWFDALDFSYDMSVPNVAHLDPQHGGCCTVMPYFTGKLVELPVTTTQDYSLIHILKDYSIDLWKQQIEMIMERHGLLSFIIHPDYIIDRREQAIYKSLLFHLAGLRDEGKVWVSTPREVAHWWRQRSKMTLMEDRGGWKVEGEGSETACVAYASEKNGRLHFTTAPQPERENIPAKNSSSGWKRSERQSG